jgi:hypothetical protein
LATVDPRIIAVAKDALALATAGRFALEMPEGSSEALAAWDAFRIMAQEVTNHDQSYSCGVIECLVGMFKGAVDTVADLTGQTGAEIMAETGQYLAETT